VPLFLRIKREPCLPVQARDTGAREC
jgi:hypothetical protein